MLPSTTPSPAGTSKNPWGDPNLVSIFDGKTLNGWVQSTTGAWVVQNGVIHGTGTAGRGYLYTQQNYGNFRWIFSLRHITGNHAACVLIFGPHPPPALDALGAIQFQPPDDGRWDYRPGHNNDGGAEFKQLPHPVLNHSLWSQCEILANQAAGTARMACCQLSAAGTGPCKAVEAVDFKDPTAGKMGPLGLQVHNGGLIDEYKDIWAEQNPTQNVLITTQ